jgi:hypothetical protein
MAESQLALAALASLCAGERDAVAILRRVVRRVRPTLVRGIGQADCASDLLAVTNEEWGLRLRPSSARGRSA